MQKTIKFILFGVLLLIGIASVLFSVMEINNQKKTDEMMKQVRKAKADKRKQEQELKSDNNGEETKNNDAESLEE